MRARKRECESVRACAHVIKRIASATNSTCGGVCAQACALALTRILDLLSTDCVLPPRCPRMQSLGHRVLELPPNFAFRMRAVVKSSYSFKKKVCCLPSPPQKKKKSVSILLALFTFAPRPTFRQRPLTIGAARN